MLTDILTLIGLFTVLRWAFRLLKYLLGKFTDKPLADTWKYSDDN